MNLSRLKNGIGFTGLMINSFKINGNRPAFWKECNLKPRRDEVLFKPDHLTMFVNDFSQRLAKNGPVRFLQIMVALRHKYINELLDHLISSGVKQVVILGAGFDVRALSFNTDSIRFFEIDCRQVHELKKETFRAKKMNPIVTYISMDYIKDSLIEKLKYQVDFDIPTLFIFEGNSMYSDKTDINCVFNQIGHHFKKYHVVLDYLSEAFIQNKTGILENSLILENNERLNARIVNGYRNIKDFTIPNGLKLVENFTFEKLAHKWGVHDGETIPEMRDYSIAYAQNKQQITGNALIICKIRGLDD